MTAECLNCGAGVSQAYVRVFAPTGAETVGCCPRCEDMTRDTHGRPRDYRTPPVREDDR